MKRIIFSLFVGATAALSALPAVQAASEPVQVVPDAPSSYTVVRGDTLWSIAGRFIKDPWRWPEVWRMNRDQIRNPHLIYPGQVVMFDGRYLSIGKPVGDPRDIRPRVYMEDSDPIPTVPMSVITPFLIRPLVMDDNVVKEARTIVALDEKRVLSGEGNIVFADNIAQDNALGWEIFRPAKPIMDVDGKTVLAYESEQWPMPPCKPRVSRQRWKSSTPRAKCLWATASCRAARRTSSPTCRTGRNMKWKAAWSASITACMKRVATAW